MANATIVSLEQTVEGHVAELGQRRAEVATLTRENSTLRSELNDALDQLGPAQQAAAGARHTGGGLDGREGAAALLRDENDILAEQVEQYNAALLQARDELSTAARENVELSGKYEAVARDLHRLENELAATGIRPRTAAAASASLDSTAAFGAEGEAEAEIITYVEFLAFF